MAKYSNPSVLDALLNAIAAGVNITVCSSQPTTYADLATYGLANGALTAGAGNGSFTIGASGSNEQLTVAQQSNLSITASGTATHVAIDDGTNLLEVTTCTSQALTSGGTVTIPSWTITATQPT